jgi:hypothetical protein
VASEEAYIHLGFPLPEEGQLSFSTGADTLAD